jgi:hypothetical protein
MAIIQSILVGKGKGKIGNVVLSNLKGQTVAKQLNSSPSNPRTVAQTDNRIKMANAVLAWQFLANFMSNAKGLRKPLESVYNAFVRMVKNGLPDVLQESRSEAAAAALRLNLLFGNWFTIDSVNASENGMLVSFSSAGVTWAETYKVRVIAMDISSGQQLVKEEPLSQSAFTAGEIDVLFTTPYVVDFLAAYIYDSASSKITNVAAMEI